MSYCQCNIFQKGKKSEGTNTQWDLAHFSRQHNGEWGNQNPKLHFKLGLTARPSHVQTNLAGTKLRAAHEREGSTSSSLAPAPAQGLVGQGEQGKHRVPIIPASKPHPRTPAHNGATSDATDLPRAKRNPSSSTQLTDTACAAFISCSKPQHLLGFFFLWPTPEICWHQFLCGSTAAYTAVVGAQTTKYPERYFLIIGAFCQILYSAFPVWITAFKSVGFALASSLLQSQRSLKKEFTEN